MRAGELKDSIIIQKAVVVQNEYGANAVEWKNVVCTRAKATYNSGNRQNENNEIVHSYTVTFVVRFYHNINNDMQIIWKGKRHRILSVNPERYKQSTTIITELINE